VNKIYILKKEVTASYITYHIKVNGQQLAVKFTHHAIERAKTWALSEQKILKALVFPDEVITGHGQRFIAHKCKNSKVIRVIYEYRENIPVIITVYVPQRARYYQGGGAYADKILP
jgi:hypothetical protein